MGQRFKLTQNPLAFVIANGDKPRTVSFAGMSKYEEIERKIKPALKVEHLKVDQLKKWPTHCTNRRTCVVIGHKNQAQRDTALNVFDKELLEQHRAIKVVTLDTS